MKTPNLVLIVLACAGLCPLFGGKTGEAEEVTIRPSHDQLSARRAKLTNPLFKVAQATTLTRKDLEKKKRADLGGLVSRSQILSHGGHWTLVPKGALLQVPPAFQSRVVNKPAGKLLSWADFYARNRGWIFTQPVEIAIARGEKPLNEQMVKNHRHQGRIVVAVMHNGPISVKAPKTQNNSPSNQ